MLTELNNNVVTEAPQQIFVLVKTYWRRLQCNIFLSSKTSWRHNCKTSCKHVLKTSWRCLENVLQDVLKTFYEDALQIRLEDFLKTSWKTKSVTLKTSWKTRNVCWAVQLWTLICKKVINMVGFLIEIGYKMIIYEQRRYSWSLFKINKRFKDTPTNLPIQFWVA